MKNLGCCALSLLLWVIASCFWVADVRAGSCRELAEDFSGLSPYTWNYDASGWSLQNERLHVGPLSAGILAVARVPFYPYGLYAADVDVSFLSGSDSQAALGIYTLTTGDFLFEIGGHTVDGVAVFYFPNTNEVQLTSWDVVAWDWYDAGILNVTAPVSSIGFEVTETAATLRVNKQNTSLRFTGTFGDIHSVINELWLMAQGSGTSAWFDDVCVDVPGIAPPPTGDYDGIWKDTGQIMNFYVQTYSTGSALIIATSDLETFYTFLDADFSDGVDVADLAGGNHHLSLNFASSDQASAVLTPSGSSPQTYAISKSFGPPFVSSHDGIWKSPSCQAGTMNYYVQSYDTGSGIVIATADLSKLYVFLDSDMSDGVDVADLAGTGAHLTLSMTSGQNETMVRCFAAPYDTAAGTPTASCSLTGLGPRPGVIHGPGGSFIELPVGIPDGLQVSINAADASGVVESGETQVSQVIRIDVTGTDVPLEGTGFFPITIPLTQTPADPSKLVFKVQLTTGVVIPVHGTYDTAGNVYVLEAAGLVDGWILGVVADPGVTVFTDTEESLTSAGWQTSADWSTHTWRLVDKTKTMNAAQAKVILDAGRAAAKELDEAGFRAPRLWIRSDIKRRIVMNHDKGNQFSSKVPDWHPNYDLASRTEEEMLLLGQLFLDYSDIQGNLASYGLNAAHVFMHELFHAVQYGYDLKFQTITSGAGTPNEKKIPHLAAYTEGTATPVAQTFQDYGSLRGSGAEVRYALKPETYAGEAARLTRMADEFWHYSDTDNAYTKQDFFTYITRAYGGKNWSWLHTLFEKLHDVSYNQPMGNAIEALKAYRLGLDAALSAKFGKSLPEVYSAFVLDRAYRHPDTAVFRPAEKTGFKANQVSLSLFPESGGISEDHREQELCALSLSTQVAILNIPEQFQADDQYVPLHVELNPAAAIGDDKVRLFAFLEGADGVMLTNGEFEFTHDGDNNVPSRKEARRMTLFVVNNGLDVTSGADTPCVTIKLLEGAQQGGDYSWTDTCTSPFDPYFTWTTALDFSVTGPEDLIRTMTLHARQDSCGTYILELWVNRELADSEEIALDVTYDITPDEYTKTRVVPDVFTEMWTLSEPKPVYRDPYHANYVNWVEIPDGVNRFVQQVQGYHGTILELSMEYLYRQYFNGEVRYSNRAPFGYIQFQLVPPEYQD